MENKNLQNFINEAEIYLPMIRSGILVCSREGNSSGEMETSLLYTRAIKAAAVSVGLENIGKACERLEQKLKSLTGNAEPLSDQQTRDLLDGLAQIEAILAKVNFSTDEFSLNFEGFVDESFSNLGFDSSHENLLDVPAEADQISFEDETAGFEIDAEMLEVFAEEADDLLRNINSHLEVLRSAPNNRESLLEIRRNAHTLKGSAGIVGLKQLSALAHRVEDLLDYLSEKEIEGNRKIFELLQTSTDCLSALAGGENSALSAKRIELLFSDFDNMLKALENGSFEKETVKIPEIVKAENTADAQTAGSENQPVAVIHKSVVRVSLEKLDELVRLVGDLVISRSVFEQRLGEFERQTGELQHTTERLLRSTGKLETDFEASLLNADFGMRNADSTSNNTIYPIDKRSSEHSNPHSAFRIPHSFDSLEFDRYTEFHQTTRELSETAGDASAINVELDKLRGNFESLFGTQSRLIEEMHDKLLRLRMVRFGSLAARLQRTVRVTCEQEMKHVDLIIEGDETEVDTQILDLLAEPLLHLLRNAVAHGIESPDTRRLLGKPEKGKILMRLHSEGTHIVLTVSDDGRGISAVALREKAIRNGFISPEEAAQMSDEEAFSLGFLPGLTTAETVSQTAGRGVGMNIIKTSILRGQGTISIASEPQKGATFTIRMPMALAITRGLLVKTNGQTFAFPLKLVKKVSEISAHEFVGLTAENELQIDGVVYTVSGLGGLLDLPLSQAKRDFIPLLLLETLDTPRALTVDEIVRAEEIVIKPLSAPLRNYPNLLGATILGDGSVVPVLDLLYLLKNQVQSQKSKAQSPENNEIEPMSAEPGNSPFNAHRSTLLKVMVVDDSPSVRHITSKLIKNAGWEVVLAKDGLEALETLQESEILPDVVLTDVEMPRMNGYELLSSIRNHDVLGEIPVIMITSRASEKHRQKAVELGVSEYMTKPFDDSLLIDKIKILQAAGKVKV